MRCRPRYALLMAMLGASGVVCAEQQVIRIWPVGASESAADTRKEIEFYAKPLAISAPMKMIRNVVNPTLTVYPALRAKATGTAVIVCPGGAFRILDWENEGTHVAEWFATRGIAAFVLKYRLVPTPEAPEAFEAAMGALSRAANTKAPKEMKDVFGDEASLNGRSLASDDARQALKTVRRHAAQWGIAPNRIGLLGFSAGGFLTMDVAIQHSADSRPDFAVVLYGGETGGQEPPPDAPPLFAAVAQNDELGMAGIVERLYGDWGRAKIPAELHVFAQGGHGFGTIKQDLPVDGWMDLLADWLGSRGLLSGSAMSPP